MKAWVCAQYGFAGCNLAEIQQPTPGAHEVLVEVYATSVTTHNLCLVTGKPFFTRLLGGGLLKPKTKIPGSDLAGRVAAIGQNVTQFKPGDEVFGSTTSGSFGALAEYVAVPENALVLKPGNSSFSEAAGVAQAALVALQGLRDQGRIRQGQRVLIYGASGGIGTFAVQMAKNFGAEVTGVCSTKNLELVRSLGADHVIDYTQEDFAKSRQRYDLIFAIANRSIFAHQRALSPKGIYVSTGSPSVTRIIQDMLIGPLISKPEGKQIKGGWMVTLDQKDLMFVKGLIETGKVKPVVGRIYPFDEAVKAFRYFGEGHARGKVIIAVKS